jgi:hypothetical protein
MAAVRATTALILQRREIERLVGEVHKGNAWLEQANATIEGLKKQLNDQLPLSLLHPVIEKRSGSHFRSGHLSDAAFNAMKAVEDELRQRAKSDPALVG